MVLCRVSRQVALVESRVKRCYYILGPRPFRGVLSVTWRVGGADITLADRFPLA